MTLYDLTLGDLNLQTRVMVVSNVSPLQIENILCDVQTGNYVLCDYGSCTTHSMHPETLGASQCEDEIARFTTLAYRSPEMVSLFSGTTITTKADIWVSKINRIC